MESSSVQNPSVIILDSQRMMTTGQYASMKGITPGRISQMKAEGKLNVFPVPEFGLELILLDDNELELTRTLPRVQRPLYSYSYRQLGGYFASLLLDYEKDLSTAERISREQQERAERYYRDNEKLTQALDELEAHHDTVLDELTGRNTMLEQSNAELIRQYEDLRQQKEAWEQQQESWQQERGQLEKELAAALARQESQADIREELAALKAEVERLRQATEKFSATPPPKTK